MLPHHKSPKEAEQSIKFRKSLEEDNTEDLGEADRMVGKAQMLGTKGCYDQLDEVAKAGKASFNKSG